MPSALTSRPPCISWLPVLLRVDPKKQKVTTSSLMSSLPILRLNVVCVVVSLAFLIFNFSPVFSLCSLTLLPELGRAYALLAIYMRNSLISYTILLLSFSHSILIVCLSTTHTLESCLSITRGFIYFLPNIVIPIMKNNQSLASRANKTVFYHNVNVSWFLLVLNWSLFASMG